VFAVILAKPALPYALSFAAGAMIFVVIEKVVPESQRDRNTDLATIGAMIGFVLMMVLECLPLADPSSDIIEEVVIDKRFLAIGIFRGLEIGRGSPDRRP